VQNFSEKIVDIENQLNSMSDLVGDSDNNESLVDSLTLYLRTTQKYLKDSHLQLIKFQHHLANPSQLDDQNEEQNEDDEMNETPIDDPLHEIEHWKLSVHKLLDQIRYERLLFHKYKIQFNEKEKGKINLDLKKSQETISHLRQQLQLEKEKNLELQRSQPNPTEVDKRKPRKSSSGKLTTAPTTHSSAIKIPSGSMYSTPPPTATTTFSPTLHHAHTPPCQQMSSLSESEESSDAENKLENDHLASSSSQKFSPNELSFLYHRDVASARAELAVLSQELLASSQRQEVLSEENLQLKQKIAVLHSHHQSSSSLLSSFSPTTAALNRRLSSMSRSYSLSPTPHSPLLQQQQRQSFSPQTHISSKITDLYSSEIAYLLNELEAKHHEEVKEMVAKLHEKLNNLYEENNSLRQQLHHLKNDYHKLLKVKNDLVHENSSLENQFQRLTKTTQHYQQLYNQLTNSPSPSPSRPRPSSSPSISPLPSAPVPSSSVADSSHSTGEDVECEDDFLQEQQEQQEKQQQTQLKETIFTLQLEKQNLLNELYELKKKNSDATLFQFKHSSKLFKDPPRQLTSSELDSACDPSSSSDDSLARKYSLRKSMSSLL
jgi:hypothetical protein